jgi:hypothetical protein
MSAKEWKAGDYIDASDLNELTTSVNWTFANAAARDSTLVGALAPTPGAVVNMQDDGLTYQRVTIAGTSYWVPPPNTFICSYQQATAQALPASTCTWIQNLTTSYARTSTWWAGNKFTPQIPGFYQLDGQISWTSAAADNGRGGLFTLNATGTLASAVPGSMTLMRPINNQTPTYPLRTSVMYFNGTTDYVALAAYNESVTAMNTVVSATAVSAVSFKYLGP